MSDRSGTHRSLLLEGSFGIDVDDQVVRRFLREFPVALELRTYGEPTVFAPGGLGRDSWPRSSPATSLR